MALRPIDEVLHAYFELPAGPGGKVYRVPDCDAKTGILCQRLLTAAIAIQNGEEPPDDMPAPNLRFEGKNEVDLQVRLLSQPILDEMLSDGLSASKITHCTSTILFWHGLGPEVAEMFWEAGGRPEDFLPAANRAARRAQRGKGKKGTA